MSKNDFSVVTIKLSSTMVVDKKEIGASWKSANKGLQHLLVELSKRGQIEKMTKPRKVSESVAAYTDPDPMELCSGTKLTAENGKFPDVEGKALRKELLKLVKDSAEDPVVFLVDGDTMYRSHAKFELKVKTPKRGTLARFGACVGIGEVKLGPGGEVKLRNIDDAKDIINLLDPQDESERTAAEKAAKAQEPLLQAVKGIEEAIKGAVQGQTGQQEDNSVIKALEDKIQQLNQDIVALKMNQVAGTAGN